MGAMLVASSVVYGTEDTTTTQADVTPDEVTQDIESTQDIDELVQKMTQTQNQYRYRYMNAIKEKLAGMKDDERKEKMKDVLAQVEKAKGNTNQRGARGGEVGGFGSTGGFGGFSGPNGGFGGGDSSSGGFGGGDSGGGMGGGGAGGGSGGGHGGW